MRLAAIALGLGLGALAFVSPQMLAGWNPVDNRAAWMITGGLKLLCGVGGLVCAILALFLRKGDNGVGLALPITGGAFSGLHLLYGLGLALAPLLMASHAGTPWKLTLPDAPAAITLPSSQWQSEPRKEGGVMFVNRIARARGRACWQQADEAKFGKIKAAYRDIFEKDPLQKEQPTFEEGVLPSGARYFYACARSGNTTGKGDVVAGVLAAWHPDKGLAVTVGYEGLVDAMSESITAAQAAGHREAARKICMSLEFE